MQHCRRVQLKIQMGFLGEMDGGCVCGVRVKVSASGGFFWRAPAGVGCVREAIAGAGRAIYLSQREVKRKNARVLNGRLVNVFDLFVCLGEEGFEADFYVLSSKDCSRD